MLEMPIVGQAVGAGNRRLHGADDDTVGKSDIAQLQGAEQHRRAARRRVMGGRPRAFDPWSLPDIEVPIYWSRSATTLGGKRGRGHGRAGSKLSAR